MNEWTWEPDDFAALWLNDGQDRFPGPLGYTSRFPTVEEAQAHRAAVVARYDRDETELIQLAFHTLTNCDLQVRIVGESTRLGGNRRRMYRLLAAQTTHHAVLLSQTVTDDVEERIRCRLFRPDNLPSRIANLFPEFSAGRSPSQTFHVDDIAPARRGRNDTYRDSPSKQFERLLSQPRDGGGIAELLPGPLNARVESWYNAQWFDILDDGRYLARRNREQVQVLPATDGDLRTLFTNWIDRALSRLRERENDHAW
ncbi:ESX secretion-associated protein EspG [Nocardia salmonicida]|uniref:ESX secretion-associated protein EspG n=1 Tax=Nocardia salmonicida TaxID=53431 RepID=UPI0007A4B295|nr:ESX secretion-associated protein EspG [Nocardia salmonicida]